MTLTQQRWLVLIASCIINLCTGSIYSWSVFALPMSEHLSAVTGHAVTNLSVVFTVANAIAPVPMIAGGYVNDRLGPKWIFRVGAIFFGGGMFFSGFARSFGMLIVSYGLGVGLAVGMVYGSSVANVVKFFPDRRGLAGGMATASYGVSSTLVPPIAGALISAFGVTATFKILGIATLIIILGCSFLIKRCPPDFVPDGWTPPVTTGAQTGGTDWRGMIRDPIFYVMLAMLLCGAFSGLMVISQASPVAQRMIGLPIALATVAVSVLSLFNTAGRLGAGFLSDKLGVVRTLAGVYLVSFIALLLLSTCATGTAFRFYAGLILVGASFGSIMGVFPGLTASLFGAKNNSVNYGIVFSGFAAAGYFGPQIMSFIYGMSGNDSVAFRIGAGLAAAGLALTIVFRKTLGSRRA